MNQNPEGPVLPFSPYIMCNWSGPEMEAKQCQTIYTADQMLAMYAQGKAEGGEEMSPEFTDTARSALAWILWHHQGAHSDIGQAIRFALGMGQFERMSDSRIAEAKRWQERYRPANQAHPAKAAEVTERLVTDLTHAYADAGGTGHPEDYDQMRAALTAALDGMRG